jgi:hypothetical protein
MPLLQDVIHRFEVASTSRFFKLALAILGVAFLAGAYDLRAFKNMSVPEAMDTAQLARNLAEGRGYTTLFIRPFSMYLLTQINQKRDIPGPNTLPDYARLKAPHPDIANPPVYPGVLAGLMKVAKFNYDIPSENEKPKPFWSNNGRFWRYQPDFLIALFNEFLFLALTVAVFFWARRLFDASAAWMSAILMLGTELFWRFSVSGLSTTLLLLIFMGLVWCLTLLENEMREPKWGQRALFALSAAAGALVGVGGLTRYAFGWLIIPVLVFLILFSGPRRATLCGVALLAFAVVLTPWIIRNYHVSGTPFGTAGYSVLEGTDRFPEYRLERSLEPDFTHVGIQPYTVKLMANTRAILQNDLPRLGGGWITALFLAGLLVGFRNPATRRLRYFLLMSLGVLIFVQAMGRTQLSEETTEINSENLLVLLAPLVLVYGVSLFFLLLDQIQLPAPELRYVVIGLFGAIVCLPLIFALLPPRPRAGPVAYPPYFPPAIQQTAGWMNEDELMMSDVPWAVAWYGKRQCLWLTLNATPNPKDPDSRENFFTINDYQKHINALYLTPETMDSRFLSQWVRAGEKSWGSFILETLMKKEVPSDFPLRAIPAGFLPEQLFLSDTKARWRTTK